MKVPLSWLREFAPIEGDPEQISVQLTDLGMELESVTHVGRGLDGIVVARVLDIRDHPDADKIRLVDVDAGDGEALQICCGASNMSVGDLVPLATIGTTMASGMEIAKRKMRGQMSNGMLCSAREMEVGDDHDGILLLPGDLATGIPIAEALDLRHDVVYEFDALPNRPDTLSVFGVARDLAAHQGVPLTELDLEPATSGADSAGLVSVDIHAPELCGRFLARVVSDVQLGQSPRWMAQRLLAAGMRPINNVVDVSNYVMLELGQPNHTYDLAKVAGASLGVRWARDDETIVTLDGMERTLSRSDGVIVDGGDVAIGIAGVMGGATTEISGSTTDVVIEVAWWDPEVVAATSARLNLHSEASLRFKRGVDTAIAPVAARRIAELLSQVAGATLHPGTVEATGSMPTPPRLRLRTSAVNGLLGTDLRRHEVAGLLDPIGYTSTPIGDDDLEVQVPTWRRDSTIEPDLIEEVGRHFGLSRIPKAVPVSPHTGELSPRQRDRREIRRALVGAGLDEAMPMPFLAPGDLERCGLPADGLVLANPLAAEESVLRTSLLPGLLSAVSYNASHRQRDVELFEVGRVFGLGDSGVVVDVDESSAMNRVLSGEVEHVAAVLAGSEAPVAVELLDLVLHAAGRTAVALRPEELGGLHPGRSAVVAVDGVDVGQVGEVDPGVLEAHSIEQRVAWLQLDLTRLLALPRPVRLAEAVSRQPSTDIDLAFVVAAAVPAAAVATTIRAAGGDLLSSVDLFDVFRSDQLGDGARSLAFRLRFQAVDRTLTDSEVAELRSRIIDEVSQTHRATLRG